MHELEKRLLQRQKTSSFLTFLVSIILLSCVERMSLLYRRLDTQHGQSSLQEEVQRAGLGNDNELQAAQFAQTLDSTPASPVWPLDSPPSAYWSQGETFSQLLHLLLRMRGLPPRVLTRDDGTMVVVSSNRASAFPVEVPTTGPFTAGHDAQTILAAQWLEKTGLTAQDLVTAQDLNDGGIGSAGMDSGRAWDLRFIAGLLFPS